MKKALLMFLLFPVALGAQVKNVTLLDHWSDSSLVTNSSSVRYSGSYSFLFEGREYGLIGSTEGLHLFQLNDDDQLQLIDEEQGAFVSSQAITREYAVYQNYLYAIGDEGTSSLQVFDLSFLPDSLSLVSEIRDERVGRAHTISIDTTNSLMYLCSVTPVINGQESSLVPLRVFSLADPLSPAVLFDGFEDLDEVHDMEIRGQIAILNCGYQGIRVYDFSDPISPVYINNLEFYQEQGYNHQGSLSENGEVYVFADETPGTRVKKCSVAADYSIQVQHLFGTENTPYDKTPHNIEVRGNLAFVAYYNDGLRIYDLRTNPPTEVGAYDTHTDEPGNDFSMWGAWGIEAGLPSKRILVSDRVSGFFLFDFDRDLFEQVKPSTALSCTPNPVSSGETISVRSGSDEITSFDLSLCDASGRALMTMEVRDQSYVELPIHFAHGTYYLFIEYTEALFIHHEVLKIIVI